VQPRDSPWALNTPTMHLWPSAFFGIFRAQGSCLVATNVVFSCWRELTALSKMSAAFEGPFRGVSK